MTDYASYEAVEDAMESMPTAYVQCRAFKHQYIPESCVWNPQYRYYTSTWVCQRCGFRKTEEISERGQVYATLPEYPEGYLLQGIGLIAGDARGAVRLAAMQRTFKVSNLRKRDAEKVIPRSAVTREALGFGTADKAEPATPLRIVKSKAS